MALTVAIVFFLFKMNSDRRVEGLYLKVTGLDCKDCPKKILDKVDSIDGVLQSSFNDDILFVLHSDDFVMPSKIIYNVCKLGFGAEDVSHEQRKNKAGLRLLDFNMRYK